MAGKGFLWAVVFIVAAALTAMPARAEEKIDTVLRNQGEILKKLEEIKSELQIVKIRASQN